MNECQRQELLLGFLGHYQKKPTDLYDIGGKIEIIGNHTDHNNGSSIAMATDLTLRAAVRVRKGTMFNIHSEGHGDVSFDLRDIVIHRSEVDRFPAYVKGLAKEFWARAIKRQGIDIWLTSDLPSGAGAGTSAAFGVLILSILEHQHHAEPAPEHDIIRVASYVERKYLHRSTGLLDQAIVAFGGLAHVDCRDTRYPFYQRLVWPFEHVRLVLVDAGGSHAGLSCLYDEIVHQMKDVAMLFHARGLAFVDPDLFHYRTDDDSSAKKSDRHLKIDYVPLQRARHFFNEMIRVREAVQAIKKKDVPKLLELINASQDSSENFLFNTELEGQHAGSPQEAVDYLLALLKHGAVKINGAGFTGTVTAFVPEEEYDDFILKARARFGNAHVKDVGLRLPGVKHYASD